MRLALSSDVPLPKYGMRPSQHPTPRPGRLRRWLVGLALLTALALAYGLSLNWFAHRLGDDVEKSLRVPDAVDSDNAVLSPR